MKKIFGVLFFMLLIVSCKPTSNIVTSKEEAIRKGIYSYNVKTFKKDVNAAKERAKSSVKRPRKSVKNSELAEQMVETAKAYLGVRYQEGGTDRNGMDCSGLVTLVYNTFDLALPRTSTEMAKVGEIIDSQDVQKGDLIFFKTNGRTTINHVGIVTATARDGIEFIHASTSKGVMISSTKEGYFQRAFAQANRVVN